MRGPVFFAGEACAPPESAQCVHGALRTGRDAADEVLRQWAEGEAARVFLSEEDATRAA